MTDQLWSDEEKVSVRAQARVPGISVARRYALNANLIHKWLRDPRCAPDEEAADFLPIEIKGLALPPPLPQLPSSPRLFLAFRLLAPDSQAIR